jgi:hypothetical protein
MNEMDYQQTAFGIAVENENATGTRVSYPSPAEIQVLPTSEFPFPQQLLSPAVEPAESELMLKRRLNAESARRYVISSANQLELE